MAPDGADQGALAPKGHDPELCKCPVCTKILENALASQALRGAEGADDDGPGGGALTPTFKAGEAGAKAIATQWLLIRDKEPEVTDTEIARRLGIGTKKLRESIYRSAKMGLITFEDPLNKLEYAVIPKAVENLAELLENKDKQATLETAKGTIFKAYTDSKAIHEQAQTVLALQITPADPSKGEITVKTAHIVGKPRHLVPDEDV